MGFLREPLLFRVLILRPTSPAFAVVGHCQLTLKGHRCARLFLTAFVLVLVGVLDALEGQLGDFLRLDQEHHLHDVIGNRVVDRVRPHRRVLHDDSDSSNDLRTDEELLGRKAGDNALDVGRKCGVRARKFHLVYVQESSGGY
jgi:hypothetical protein